MAALNTLPNETLTPILSGLPNSDLGHLSFRSRGLNAVAESMLYKGPCLTEASKPCRSEACTTCLSETPQCGRTLDIFLPPLSRPG